MFAVVICVVYICVVVVHLCYCGVVDGVVIYVVSWVMLLRMMFLLLGLLAPFANVMYTIEILHVCEVM